MERFLLKTKALDVGIIDRLQRTYPRDPKRDPDVPGLPGKLSGLVIILLHVMGLARIMNVLPTSSSNNCLRGIRLLLLYPIHDRHACHDLGVCANKVYVRIYSIHGLYEVDNT